MPYLYFAQTGQRIVCDTGVTLFEAIRASGVLVPCGYPGSSYCFGFGICGKCSLYIDNPDAVSSPSWIERFVWFRGPKRLSCQTRIYGNVSAGTEPFRSGLSVWADIGEADAVEKETTVAPVPDLLPVEVRERLDAGFPIVLLDVREPYEIERARLSGAVEIPLGSLPDRLGEVPRETCVVVVCHHGLRSRAAAEFLLSAGYGQVVNMRGGIDLWSLTVDAGIPRY
ncbi:MAG: 2Fe-2S iron-sulfur cluster binding domain-containing protein [candidate division Zixibacteria bacterium]|nr:2Fe-2S iron-sulfur cluster binding domain-containing protein [candidate division Zixibacteria bacterium]